MIFVSIIVVLCVDHPTEKRVQQHTKSLTTLTILSTPTKLTISTYHKNYQEEICRIRIVYFVLFVVFLCFILPQHDERSVYVHCTSISSDFLYLILGILFCGLKGHLNICVVCPIRQPIHACSWVKASLVNMDEYIICDVEMILFVKVTFMSQNTRKPSSSPVTSL